MMIPSVPLATIENGDRTPAATIFEQMLRISVGGSRCDARSHPRARLVPLRRPAAGEAVRFARGRRRGTASIRALRRRRRPSSTRPGFFFSFFSFDDYDNYYDDDDDDEWSVCRANSSSAHPTRRSRLLTRADQLTMDGRIALAAAGTTMATTMRDALLWSPPRRPVPALT